MNVCEMFFGQNTGEMRLCSSHCVCSEKTHAVLSGGLTKKGLSSLLSSIHAIKSNVHGVSLALTFISQFLNKTVAVVFANSTAAKYWELTGARNLRGVGGVLTVPQSCLRLWTGHLLTLCLGESPHP